MFYQFRDVIKENGARGWRLEEENRQFFLSKFDDTFNDNEIRIFVTFDDEGVHMEKAIKIKNYQKEIELDSSHKYVKKAEELCQLYNQKVLKPIG